MRSLGRSAWALPALLFGLIGIGFWILKAFAWGPAPGDEFIYFYQGFALSQGKIPYRDFFMAHPPAQAVLTAIYCLVLGGFHYTAARALPWIWATLSGAALFLLIRKELGTARAVMAAILFLFGYDELRASSHLSGVNQAVAFLMLALLAARTGRPRLAGAFGALALLTRLYVLPSIALILLSGLVLQKPGQRLRFTIEAVLSGTVIFLLGLGVFIGLAGWGPVYDDVFRYHWSKPAMEASSLSGIWSNVLYNNFSLYFGGAVGGLAALGVSLRDAWQRRPIPAQKIFLLLVVVLAVSQLAVLFSVDRVWMFYFVPAYPFLAVLAADVLVSGVAALVPASGPRLSRAWPVLLLGVLIVGWVYHLRMNEADSEAGDRDGVLRRYDFKPAPLPSWVNGLVRTLFWRDERIEGTFYSVPTLYLWHESRTFDAIFEAADLVRQRCGSGDTLFGDSGTAPLLSLLSGCRLAGDEADTNILRFRSGLTDASEFMKRIRARNPRFVFLRPRFGVAGLPEVNDWIRQDFAPVRTLSRAGEATFILYERKD